METECPRAPKIGIPQNNPMTMEKKTVRREDESILIEAQIDSNNILIANWMGVNVPLEEVKMGCALLMEVFDKHGCRLLYNDNRQVSGSWDDSNEWLAEVFFPEAISKGLRRMAHVLSDDLFTELSAEFMAENLETVAASPDVFQVRLFRDGNEALQWLRRQAV